MSNTFSLVYIENCRLPTEKAHGYQIMKTCEAFGDADVQVSLIHAKRHNPKLKDQDIFEYYKISKRFSIQALPVIDFLGIPFPPLWRFAYVLERASFLFSLKKQLPKFLSQDIWYTRDVAIAATMAQSTQRKPIILELHDDPRSNKKRWNIAKQVVCGYIVITKALRDLLLAEGIPAQDICLAPDAFDAEAFAQLPDKKTAREKLHIASDAKLLIYTGHLFPWKGMDTLAPAFDQLPPGWELVIVGGNPDDIKRVQAQVPAGAPVRFLGQQSREDVLPWLAAADAALLPTSSTSELGRLYTSPLKLFEYLAAGLPVIASDVPSSREMLNESVASFFTPDDGDSFIRALTQFDQSSLPERELMSKELRIRGAEYTWKNRGATIADFIQRKNQD